MGRRVESEELELEPLLISSHNLQSELDVDDMSVISDVRDVDYDKDTEKVDTRAVSVAESFTDSSPEEQRLVRKLDTRILPIVCILYLFACESLCSASTSLFIMCIQIWIGPTWGMLACRVSRKIRWAGTLAVSCLTG